MPTCARSGLAFRRSSTAERTCPLLPDTGSRRRFASGEGSRSAPIGRLKASVPASVTQHYSQSRGRRGHASVSRNAVGGTKCRPHPSKRTDWPVASTAGVCWIRTFTADE